MKFASISSLLLAARATLLRFPAALVSALFAAGVAIDLVGSAPAPDRSIHLLMAASLGIPLFTALRLYSEKSHRGGPLARPWILMSGGAVCLFVYWHLLNRDPGDGRYLRYFQISLACHLAVAIAPFLGRGEINGFWQFNRRLFLRAFLSSIYASVFFGGLALALGAMDHLFEMRIEGELYLKLWMFTVFVFQTWHFLSGVPSDLAGLERDREHPKALKIFTQYMLVPLVVLYVSILYAYMGKILLSRQWPQGWVAWLVSYASIFGFLTLLLLYPGRQERENRWIKMFERGFYAAALPLLGLLFVALGKRVEQYGMTERRYFLLVLGLWLGGVALYMLFGPAKNIKIVPTTLGLLALLTACGPWGAYQVSLRSQSGRLQALLTKHGLVSEGRLVKAGAPVDQADLKEISATVDYIVEQHGARALNRWGDRNWAEVKEDSSAWDRRTAVDKAFLAAMGLEYVSPWSSGWMGYYRAREERLEVAGYDWLIPTQFMDDTKKSGPGVYSARFDRKRQAVEILEGPIVVLSQSLEPLLSRLPAPSSPESASVPASAMTVVARNGSLRAKICFSTLMLNKDASGAPAVQNGTGYLLIDAK